MRSPDRLDQTPGERDALTRWSWFMAPAVFGVWIVTAIAASRAPWVRDLYALVYQPIRPHRVEGTAMFLFGMPAFLTAGWTLIVAQARGWTGLPRTSPLPSRLSPAILAAWTGFLVAAAVHRAWIVYTHVW